MFKQICMCDLLVTTRHLMGNSNQSFQSPEADLGTLSHVKWSSLWQFQSFQINGHFHSCDNLMRTHFSKLM